MLKMHERSFEIKSENMIELGRVCLKIAGREAGKYCVIVERIDDNFVLITGPKSITRVKRRKCNINHLESTEERFDINPKADDSQIEELWKRSNLIKKLEIKVPIKRKEKPKEKSAKEKQQLTSLQSQQKSKQKDTKSHS